jgi:hypothetical protein
MVAEAALAKGCKLWRRFMALQNPHGDGTIQQSLFPDGYVPVSSALLSGAFNLAQPPNGCNTYFIPCGAPIPMKCAHACRDARVHRVRPRQLLLAAHRSFCTVRA